MIRFILDALKVDDFYAKDWTIDVAKGLHEFPRTWKMHYERTKRIKSWQNSSTSK
jgi:hypothetical protein